LIVLMSDEDCVVAGLRRAEVGGSSDSLTALELRKGSHGSDIGWLQAVRYDCRASE
jgi:hypothetical protein